MKLFELDDILIKINQIKDIKSIDYNDLVLTIAKDKIKILPGFIVFYGSGDYIYLTSQDKHFEVFVKKLRETYEKEKDNILKDGVLGKEKIKISTLSKAILESKELEEPNKQYKKFIDKDYYKESLLFEEDKVKALIPIIIYHLKDTLKLFDLNIDKISLSSGMNGNYYLNAILNNISTILPVNYRENGFNSVSISIGNLFKNSYSLTMNIEFSIDKISILIKIDGYDYTEYVNYVMGDFYKERYIYVGGNKIYFTSDKLDEIEKNKYENLVPNSSLKWCLLPWNAYLGGFRRDLCITESGTLEDISGNERIIDSNIVYLSVSDYHYFIKEIFTKRFSKRVSSNEQFQSINLDTYSKTVIGLKNDSLVEIETSFEDSGISSIYKKYLAGNYFYQISSARNFDEISKDNTCFIGRENGLIENTDLLEPKKYIKGRGL